MSDTCKARYDGLSGFDLVGPDGRVFGWAADTSGRPVRPPAVTPTIASATPPAPSPVTLAGPFITRHVAGRVYDLIGKDSVAAARVAGRGNAEFMARLLNLAHRHGKLGGSNVGKGPEGA